MTEKKEFKPDSIKFWLGLKDAIKEYATSQGIPFSTAVNHLCDRGLYLSAYKFPFHKPKYTMNGDEEEENDGSEK